MNDVQRIELSKVVFRTDLYPRLETSAVTVQKYAEDLDVLPPIELNQHNELIDGWHRWTAHKKAEAETVPFVVTKTASDVELLELAIERNAIHGLQLSQSDKQNMARTIYNATPVSERDEKKKQLAKILSVSERAIRDWLSRIDKDTKEARNRRIFDRWLACYTQEEIAEAESTPQKSVDDVLAKTAKSPDSLESSQKAAASHATDFQPPIYNVWKQQEKTAGSSHFGNSDVRWVDNLLYMYTKSFDVVIDPFGGGGSTIDICKKRLRRYFVSDRKPVVERENEIRKHDLTDGLPPLPKLHWKDVRLVYLDPPYWKQAEGQYSEDPSDLANMDLQAFNKNLSDIIGKFGKQMSGGGHIALILQPTQWKAENREYTDHVAEMIRRVGLPIAMRIQAPYESQQCNAQMVEWAKENRTILVLSREIVVWKV